MLDVKEAARKASEYFAGLYSDQKIPNVQLEEVEISDDGEHWLITLSYPVAPELAALNFNFKRKYKVFTIDAKTGEVKSMKIRKVE
jgi:hypothetical protein